MPARRSRNSLGSYQESWLLDEPSSDHLSADKVFLPPPGGWLFRSYIKRGRRYVEGDRGTLHNKRVRVYAQSVEEAKQKAARVESRIKQHGQLVADLTTEDMWEMVYCLKVCAPLGIRPFEACQQVARNHPKGDKARTVAQVAAEVIGKKRSGNRRKIYVDTLERTLTTFASLFPDRGINTVTAGELDDELDAHPNWAPGTIHGVVSSWKVLFNFAKRRGYCTDNPAEKIDLPAKDTPEPVIFTIDQVRRMMAHTLFDDRDPLLPHCQLYCAIGIFAGIRPDEIDRLEWSDIDVKCATITVQGAKAKCRARRIVDISPNLLTWITPHTRRHGPVLVHPVARLRLAMRTAMGLAEWPHDVLRHSFGSYHFGAHRNESLVKNQMGHSDDGRMFFSHYRVLVHPGEAAKFWRIVRPVAFLTA